jgi:flagellar biosynthesis component FlhA
VGVNTTIFLTSVVISFPTDEQNEQLRQEAERESHDLLKVMGEHKRMAQESSDKLKQRNVSYQRDLEMQIGYQKTMKAREKEEELDDYLAGKVC